MQHLAGSVLAGKRLCAYIFLHTHFYATRMFYISKYMVNLGLGDNYQALINLIYLYIYVMYRSWVSCCEKSLIFQFKYFYQLILYL